MSLNKTLIIFFIQKYIYRGQNKEAKLAVCFMFQQLSNILKDPEASSNDKFVALELLKNANVAAGMVLPGCQDTGTAICMGNYFYSL